jgi:hypothetical protein
MISQKTRRAVLAWAVILALAARGFIPAGVMPNMERTAAHPFAMTICGGHGPMVMDAGGILRSAGTAPDKNDGKKLQDHEACPFSVNVVFAFNGWWAALPPPVYLFVAMLTLAAFARAQTRPFGNASPRAPPRIS